MAGNENWQYNRRIMSSAEHASLPYQTIEQAGSPALPLDFPSPQVHRAFCTVLTALNHRTGSVCEIKNVLVNPSSNRAYLVKKKIANSTYGSIRICVVLQRRGNQDRPIFFLKGGVKTLVEWKSTDELVAIKTSSWDRIRTGRGKHLKDPLKEAAALQHVGSYHENLLGCLEVLQDETCLYTVMPHCAGGDLYSKIPGLHSGNANLHTKPPPKSVRTPNEEQARASFRQLLQALFHLQKKGVCHRDISLENLMLDEHNNLVLIDFGLALRVPYLDKSNYGGVSDVSEGTCRRLIRHQGLSGNGLTYLAPELLHGTEAFDGFAVDLWAAGVVLFILLVGMAPFKWANLTDYRYQQINRGKLRELVLSLNVKLSDEACDLLQSMFWQKPRKRLTLSQVLSHPWVMGSGSDSTPPAPFEEERDDTPRAAFSPKRKLMMPLPTIQR